MARGHAWQGGHAWHTVNERAVRILLECILFSLTFSVIEAALLLALGSTVNYSDRQCIFL